VAFGATACSDGTAPIWNGAPRTPLTPPEVYRTRWSETVACAGVGEGDYGGIRWFTTPAFAESTSSPGQWNSRREITLLEGAVDNRGVVRHEILHDLLRGDVNRSDPAWVRCGVPIGVG
jgi:hypothetical protein